MSKEKKVRDKAAEKAVKERLGKTHIMSYKIVGSQVDDPSSSTVYMLRMIGNDNYLFKIPVAKDGGKLKVLNLVPVKEKSQFGEYRVYNPLPASAEALKPTPKEKKKFKGYKK